MRQFQFGRHPGAVIDQALEIHVLGERHEHAAIHAGRRAVHRMVAPGLRALEVHDDLAVGGDLHLDRDVVEPVGIAERLVAGLALGDVAVEGVAAIDAGHGELAGAGELGAAAFLDELLRHLHPVVEADLVDQRLDAFAHVDAGGDLGLLVEHPVDRHAQIALAADDIVAADLVVLADLLGADEQALGEALLRQATSPPGVMPPASSSWQTAPAQPTSLPEWKIGTTSMHVGHLHGADEGIVVGEDIAVADARVLLVAVADHPFDEAAHRVDMHHDAVGERDGIAFGRVDGDHHLADLAHAGRGGDAAGHLAGRDAIGAQLGVQRLEFQRILVAQREFGDAVIAAGLFHQPLGIEQPFAKAQRGGRFVQHGGRPLKRGCSAAASIHRHGRGPADERRALWRDVR